jgi:hypothetical protein
MFDPALRATPDGRRARILSHAGEIQDRTVEKIMTRRFKVGDHVGWNSEAGRVSGHIIRVHTRDIDWHGYTHHASADEPQYEIRSDKTDHIALHKGRALHKLGS